jgi:hypothetical protein
MHTRRRRAFPPTVPRGSNGDTMPGLITAATALGVVLNISDCNNDTEQLARRGRRANRWCPRRGHWSNDGTAPAATSLLRTPKVVRSPHSYKLPKRLKPTPREPDTVPGLAERMSFAKFGVTWVPAGGGWHVRSGVSQIG